MKLQTIAAPAALAVATGLLVSSAATPDIPGVGDTAPDISARTWFNNLGPEPSLALFQGHAVLLEFWATW